MLILKKRSAHVFAGLVAGFFCSTAIALDLNLGFDVGIDKKTRALIQQMPAEVRVQIEKLLVDAQPLIDQSVLLYLNRIDQILADRLSQVQCVADGVTKTAIEELIAKLKPWKDGPTVVGDLAKSVEHYPDKVKRKFTPEQYRITYADLLNNAHTVACAVKDTPIAEQEVMKIRFDLTTRIRPWVRLEDESCADAHSCLQLMKGRVGKDLSLADIRDSSEPKKRLDEIEIPKQSWGNFNPLPYEINLREVYEISDEVKIKTELRKFRGTEAMNNATKIAENLDSILKAAQQIGNNKQALESAIETLVQHKNDKISVEKTVSNAMDILPSLASDGKILNARIHSLDANIDPIIATLRVRIVSLDKPPGPFVGCSGGGGGGGKAGHCNPY
ncbi:hypothetical protein V8G57_08100 [Collimonas sp. H4R21]|uniref:Uncharacterized protein n=1 Tax=Collimonas rhizosphaerae TaxID=3126357 RepID=A0ABU9PTL3_9BURK